MELVKLRHRARGQLGKVIAEGLDLNDEWKARAFKEREHVAKLRDDRRRSVQRILLKLIRAQILKVALAPGHALDVAVVEDGERPVAQQVHVKLRAEAVCDGAREGLHRIFRNARGLIVEPPVRVAELPQRRHGLCPAARAQQNRPHERQNQANSDNNE